MMEWTAMPFKNVQNMQNVSRCLARAGVTVREEAGGDKPYGNVVMADLESNESNGAYVVLLKSQEEADTLMDVLLKEGYAVSRHFKRVLRFQILPRSGGGETWL